MDPAERHQRQREAKRRLGAQRRRAGILRSRVVALSIVCFALLWAVVFVQMATGNDPVLGGGRRTAGATAIPPEAIETAPPEESESQVIDPEPVEPELVEIEPEPEPEPVPVETAQS